MTKTIRIDDVYNGIEVRPPLRAGVELLTSSLAFIKRGATDLRTENVVSLDHDATVELIHELARTINQGVTLTEVTPPTPREALEAVLNEHDDITGEVIDSDTVVSAVRTFLADLDATPTTSDAESPSKRWVVEFSAATTGHAWQRLDFAPTFDDKGAASSWISQRARDTHNKIDAYRVVEVDAATLGEEA